MLSERPRGHGHADAGACMKFDVSSTGYEGYNSIVYDVDVYLLKTIEAQVCRAVLCAELSSVPAVSTATQGRCHNAHLTIIETRCRQ